MIDAYLRLERGIVEGHSLYGMLPLKTETTIIGRFSQIGREITRTRFIKTTDDYVSREHVIITYDQKVRGFFLQERNTGTKNGTFINEEQLIPGQYILLKDGDLIQLAKCGDDYRLVFRYRESEGTLVGSSEREKAYQLRELKIDLRGRKITLRGKEVSLRKKEFDLLVFLYQNLGKVCSKDEIAQEVWKEEGGIVSQETIEQNISRIRKAIEVDPKQHHFIKTIHGGYRLDP